MSRTVNTYFNRAASTYDAHSSVQQMVGVRLINDLSRYDWQFENVIDLGCGTGTTTQRLINTLGLKRLHAIDIAEQVVNIATKRPLNRNIMFKVMDFETIDRLDEKYDLIFSNMALQWSHHLQSTFATIYQQLTDDGVFAFSIPLIETFAELPATSVNRFYSLCKISNFLTQLGFVELRASDDLYIKHFDTAISALRSIKYSGASLVIEQKHKSLRKNLPLFSTLNDGFQLTYHIGFFLARKIN